MNEIIQNKDLKSNIGSKKKSKKWTSSSAFARYQFDLDEIHNTPHIDNSIPEKCPFCGSTSIIKNGHSCCHRQRYKCKNCAKTITTTYGTQMYRSRLNQFDLKKISLFINNSETVRGTARRIGVNRNTAQKYRKMILNVLNIRVKSDDTGRKLTGTYAMVDEIFIPDIGTIKNNDGIKKRGISNQKMAIAIGIDSTNYVKAYNAGVGHVSANDLMNLWKDKINKDMELIHDKNVCYDFNGFEKETSVNSQIKKEEQKLNPLNAICESIKWFLMKHHGIKKKNLDLYLTWYMFIQNVHPEKKNTIYKFVGLKNLKTTLSTIN